MKIRKFLILLLGVSAMVAMLVSCTSRTTFTMPSTLARAIETTMIEVTGDNGEKLKIQFSRKTGQCERIWVDDKERDCDDKDIVIPIEKTFFCTTPDDKHPANTAIYGKIDAYCGNIEFLTDGADIKYKKSDSAAGNRKCKKIGGKVYCYPP
jgi:hypothetical protein